MSDLIERDKAIANMRKNHDVNLGTLPTGNRSYEDIWHCVAIAYDEGIEYAIKVLNGMPSAQPELQWIPCSERLPKPFEFCLWTTTDGRVVYHHCDGMFSEYTAWMPLPEPWRGEEHD